MHIEICVLTRGWPIEEKYELGPQVRRSSNSAPSQLAEKHWNRHLKNKLAGINGSRDECAETIHHLYMAQRKAYITVLTFDALRGRYEECMRMLSGMENMQARPVVPET